MRIRINEKKMDSAIPIEAESLKIPFCGNIISVGATNTGKTYNILRMLEKPEDVWSNVPAGVGITYIYGAFQNSFLKHMDRIRFLENWDHDELSVPALLNTRDRFFVIDDAYAGAGDRIRHLMVTLSHHQVSWYSNFDLFLWFVLFRS